MVYFFFFFSSRRRHTRSKRDWSSDVCSSDLHPRLRQDCRLTQRAPPEARQGATISVYRLIDIQEQRTDAAGDGGEEIGRASCRKECRSRWSPERYKKKDDRARAARWHEVS